MALINSYGIEVYFSRQEEMAERKRSPAAAGFYEKR
jgi:hypothetical protein